jgi:putative FmdB family regulatory protein
MPVYEYGCDAGHHFEVKQKMTDAPITLCQVCSLPVSKLISAPAISFKGSGWYVTDYSNKMKPPGSEEKTDKPATAADSAKKDAAPSTGGGGDGGGASPSPPSTPTTKPESAASSGSSSGSTPSASTGS